MSEEELIRLRDLFDEKVRHGCRFIGREKEILDRVVRVIGPTRACIDNVVMWSDLDESNADEEIESQIDFYSALGHSFHWIVYHHDQPGDLMERLEERGFSRDVTETVVIAPSDGIEGPESIGDVDLRRITDPGELDKLTAVQTEVWGTEHRDFLVRWLTDLLREHGDTTIILIGVEGEKPVAASWVLLWDDRPFAPLFGGSVIPGWRGRGIYRAMVAERARAISRKGIPWCLVDAGPESFPILKRIGFETMTARTSMKWGGGGSEGRAMSEILLRPR